VPKASELVIELWQNIMPLSIVTKFHEDLTKTVWLRGQTSLQQNVGQFKGRNSEVPGAITWLSIVGDILCL